MSDKLASDQPSWKKLEQLYESKGKSFDLRQAFHADPSRFSKYSRHFQSAKTEVDLLLDFSKNLIDDEILSELLSLAKQAQLEQKRDAMFAGEHINSSEDRAVLHVALRDLRSEFQSKEPGLDVIGQELAHMKQFTEAIRSGSHKGYSGKPISSIVNIGIGGSDLGPVFAVEALKAYTKRDLKSHFVSNIDGTHIAEILKECEPESTLFIIASKTFTTQETLTNANTAKEWFLKTAKNQDAVAKHFVAVSTAAEEVTKFGIAKENMFQFGNYVGGRYSLWSPIGLSIALAIGYENFEQFLEGAHEMDKHFKTAPLDQNIPVLLGLLAVWYADFHKAQTHAVLPYDQYLHRFPAYLQQLEMESLGKQVTKNGERVNYNTSSVLFGEPGTNGQHSFYQMLHQGTHIVPADFIAPAQSLNPVGQGDQDHHPILLSNFFAQTEALAFGKTEAEVKEELGAQASSNNFLVQSKIFTGSRPTNSMLVKKMTPATLGALIALYEHRTFTEGAIWSINQFDQFGVELGKVLAKGLLPILRGQKDNKGKDSSTTGLINYYLQNK